MKSAILEISQMLCDPITRYQLLLKINNAIIKQYTREALFRSLATEIGKIFHYDRFSINLYNPETNTISYFATAEGIDPTGINEKTRPLEHGSIAQLVIQSLKPVFIYDLSQNPQLATARSMVRAGLNSTMAFPMVIRKKILGSIHFSFKQSPPNIFELREFLNDLSVQVAIAVDNMLSYEKLKGVTENLKREKRFLLDNVTHSYQFQKGNFYYASQSIARIMNEIELIAETDASVLISGETGTGKGHMARCIHNLSLRKNHLFVEVNCAALAPTLIESELFGHAKGAYTGADSRRIGRFEMANKGTIFLDEIGELPLNVQAKLLQVLQDKTFERVGESTPRSVNFRVIVASNQDLKLKIQEKTFRSDLYYRLNTIHIHIPPLRERREDISLLVQRLTIIYAEKMHRPEPRYTSSAIELLCSYSWPGNVRELENLLERMIILRAGDEITDLDINNILNSNTLEMNSENKTISLTEMEKKQIEKALIRCDGVVGGPHGAAHLLGMPRSTLQYRIKKLGIDLSLISPKHHLNQKISHEIR
ncbi:MAG TPA: sigma-54-dependent Fis family transcriptional regulator [Nitrospirae bacterium]|nr:sigma-54-dependent Fis family transcriptional regulator [Nitrospirota bacterium]